MHDSFAVIRWRQAGVSPSTTAVLWSESVATEVLVFLFLGPRILRAFTPTVALAVAAFCGLVRWAVMAQTVDVAALALIQPLHGFTFALLYLASMRIIADTVPRALAATAQAVYGLVGVGGADALLMLLSGWLYARGRWVLFALPHSPSSGCCIECWRRPRQSDHIFLERQIALRPASAPPIVVRTTFLRSTSLSPLTGWGVNERSRVCSQPYPRRCSHGLTIRTVSHRDLSSLGVFEP
jgi:MFS family permease